MEYFRPIYRMNEFQTDVRRWILYCFGEDIANNVQERNYRFLEESLELVQALGATKEDAHSLVDYVFNRPVGEVKQEVGGVMVTLSALCSASDIDLGNAAFKELYRVQEPDIMKKIRRKHKTKPHLSPLPGTSV